MNEHENEARNQEQAQELHVLEPVETIAHQTEGDLVVDLSGIKELNLASLTKSNTVVGHTWTRILRSTMKTSIKWTVSVENPAGVTLSVIPSSFTLAPGEYQTITISADVTAADFETWLIGR